MSAPLDVLETRQLLHIAPTKLGIERRRRKRVMLAVQARVRGAVGTLDTFEEIVTSLDLSRDGVLLSTSRGGYCVGDRLQVTCPYWDVPTAINIPRKAKVIRSSMMANFEFALALQYVPGICDDHVADISASPFPNQVRILGMESGPQLAQNWRELLEQDGYNGVVTSKAQQALEILQTEAPDLILAEAEGGEISGNDLCAIIKTCPRVQHVPVILLAKSALPSNYAISRQLGVVLCMTVPCTFECLLRAIHLVAPPPAFCPIYSARFNTAAFVRTS